MCTISAKSTSRIVAKCVSIVNTQKELMTWTKSKKLRFATRDTVEVKDGVHMRAKNTLIICMNRSELNTVCYKDMNLPPY